MIYAVVVMEANNRKIDAVLLFNGLSKARKWVEDAGGVSNSEVSPIYHGFTYEYQICSVIEMG